MEEEETVCPLEEITRHGQLTQVGGLGLVLGWV